MLNDNAVQTLLNIDRTVHEPVRLVVMVILSLVETTDFLYLLNTTGVTKGNLSSHLLKLEEAGYIHVEKTYRGRIPMTLYRFTKAGEAALQNYLANLSQIPNVTVSSPAKPKRKAGP